jgi:hypothetical protein
VQSDRRRLPPSCEGTPREGAAEATGGLSVAILRDSTLCKRVEDELIVARGAVEAMRDLADRMRLSTRPLLSDASADLRQPLQALTLLNRMLRGTVKDPDAAQLVLEQERSIMAMTKLLDDLVDTSRRPNLWSR